MAMPLSNKIMNGSRVRQYQKQTGTGSGHELPSSSWSAVVKIDRQIKSFVKDVIRVISWHGPIWSAKLIAGRLLGVHPMNRYLRQVSGVIHVGANTGQERYLYASYGLDVLWIEPIPSAFDELCKNISVLPKQRALNCL